MTNTLDARGLSTQLPITDTSQVAESRRRLGIFAETLGFNEDARGRLAIVVTEMATNIITHARSGYLLCRAFADGQALEILAVDRGPGMGNLSECMRDGFSTNGTAGNGLGAMSRLADLFEVYTVPDQGTVVLVQFFMRKPQVSERFLVGAVCLPLPDQDGCGDGWSIHLHGSSFRTAIVDGLGHGIEAEKAAVGALACLAANPGLRPGEVIKRADGAIAATRGAAMALCDVDADSKEVVFCGVGNISCALLLGATKQRSMVSHNGIVGHQMRKVQEFPYQWAAGAILIMHSDGLMSRWTIDNYPGLMPRHPALIAGVLYRDFNRGRDDISVVVVREAS